MISVILHNRVSEDAPPDEADVLEQVESVQQALENLNQKVITLEFDLDLKKTSDELQRIKPDFVFNLVESVDGSGQLIYLATSLLEHLKIPYTGCSNETVFLTSNKLLAKKILKYNGIPTPDWIEINNDNSFCPFEKDKYIIKSVWEHASVDLDESNVIFAETLDRIKSLIIEKTRKNNKIFFAERYIDGREFNISVLAGKILPFAEIDFSNYDDQKLKIVDYKAKWEKDSFEYNNTPRTFDFDDKDRELLREIEEITKKCLRVFNLKGYARVDFRVDKSNRPFVLEINSNPCISPDGGFYAAAIKSGLTTENIIAAITEDSLSGPGRF